MQENLTPVSFAPFVRFVIEFHNKAQQYSTIVRHEIENNQSLLKAEKGIIEEAILIKATAEWEVFLHKILAYCIALDTTKLSTSLGYSLPSKLSFNNAFAVLNGIDYLSITNEGKIKEISKRVITESLNPFVIDTVTIQLKLIDEVYLLRNYIVHKSQTAKNKLIKLYHKHNIKDFIPPRDFLLIETVENEICLSNSQRYYGAFLSVAMDIWEHLDITSYKFVHPDTSTVEGIIDGLQRMRSIFAYFTETENL